MSNGSIYSQLSSDSFCPWTSSVCGSKENKENVSLVLFLCLSAQLHLQLTSFDVVPLFSGSLRAWSEGILQRTAASTALSLSLPLFLRFLPVFRWFCCQFPSPENIWLVKSKHAVKNFMCYEPQKKKKTEMKFHNSSVRCFSCVIAYGNDYMGTYICIIYLYILLERRKCSSLVSKDFVVVLDHS